MADTFYWYDLETSGTDPKWDRIVQFAGLRTDAELNPLEEEFSTYVQLADDVLPNPEASLVTGIHPQLTHDKGISETQALLEIHARFSQPGTCVAGYNSLRFDDEFIRYGLYRNLLDPYAREWQQGNSRWDIIDLVRATGALRRDGINWPVDEDGLPVYKLEVLTQANNIEHGHAHDAMSDVHATVSMARLIRRQQRKLFDFYFSIRHKKKIRALLEPFTQHVRVHVSGMYPRARFGVAPILPMARHPSNGNSVIVVDLAEDIEVLLEQPAAELAEHLFTPGAEQRPPLKEIRLNRCPFVAPFEVLNEENLQRLEIDPGLVKERARRLRRGGIAEKLARVYQQPRPAPAADPDAALYDGFLQDEDRSRCQHMHTEISAGRWPLLDFNDQRLAVLARRMKARSFAGLLDADELQHWGHFVISKLEGEGDWLNLQEYEQRLEALMLDQSGPAGQERNVRLLQQLAEHAMDLRRRYRL